VTAASFGHACVWAHGRGAPGKPTGWRRRDLRQHLNHGACHWGIGAARAEQLLVTLHTQWCSASLCVQPPPLCCKETVQPFITHLPQVCKVSGRFQVPSPFGSQTDQGRRQGW
jgi:hypothetical protein